jgi:hypothetical protein
MSKLKLIDGNGDEIERLGARLGRAMLEGALAMADAQHSAVTGRAMSEAQRLRFAREYVQRLAPGAVPAIH